MDDRRSTHPVRMRKLRDRTQPMAKTMEEEIDGLDLTGSFSGEADTKEERPEHPKKPEDTPEKPEEVDGEGGEPEKPESAGKPEEGKDDRPKDGEGPFGNKGHTPKGVQQRINELSRSNRETREENARLKREIEELKRFMPKPPEKTRDEFASDEEWVNHLAERKAREIFEREGARVREENEMREAQAQYAKSEDAARIAFDDYDDVMSREVNLPVDRDTYLYVMKSPVGAMVNYTIRNVDAVRNQFLMTPEAGKLEFVKSVESRIIQMKEQSAKKAPENRDAPPQETPKAPEQQQKPSLRQPQEVRHPVSRAPNPATCSMDEWMDYGD